MRNLILSFLLLGAMVLGSPGALAMSCQLHDATITSAAPRTLWSSLDAPPSPQEAQEMVRAKITFAEFDFRAARSDVIARLRAANVMIFAYDVGNGGGAEWGEANNLLAGADATERVRQATLRALLAGADGLHLDNMHAIDTARLESFMDAQVAAARDLAREPMLHLKNATSTYLSILQRRVDLRPYVKVAVVEHLSSSPEAARNLAYMGIPVFGIEFARSHTASPVATLPEVETFVRANPWVSGVWALPAENAYDARTGVFVTASALCTIPS